MGMFVAAAASVCRVLDGLRAELDAQGFTRFDVRLPEEDSAVAPLEGALRVRPDAGRFVLETVDYGEAFRLLSAESEPGIVTGGITQILRRARDDAAICARPCTSG